jgi:hypothetical protein
VTDKVFRQKNHYVPEFLLRKFSSPQSEGFISEYRLLVEDQRVPEWDLRPVSRVARTSDLYTIAEGSDQSDGVERWLDEEFECPAREAVDTVIADRKLTKDQWLQLVRLYAAQLLRTPAYFIRHKDQWAYEMNTILLETRDCLLAELPLLNDIEGESLVIGGKDGFPLRYTIRRLEGLRRSLHIEHVTGRKHWMWLIRSGLRPDGQLAQLERYKWTIVKAPAGIPFFLTDNPAVCVRRRPDGSLSLHGGWGALHSKLMLPLSPNHLLYYQVGSPMQDRSITAHPLWAQQLRADLADAALRSFYCQSPDEALSTYRPRRVDRARFREEAAQWMAFGQEHSLAERFL